MNQRIPRPESSKSKEVPAARSAGARGEHTRRQVLPNARGTCEASDHVEEMNEDCHLDSLKALPRQDVEQTTATELNRENRQRIWGQAKVGFSGNSDLVIA